MQEQTDAAIYYAGEYEDDNSIDRKAEMLAAAQMHAAVSMARSLERIADALERVLALPTGDGKSRPPE